jgi:hypothetical protein
MKIKHADDEDEPLWLSIMISTIVIIAIIGIFLVILYFTPKEVPPHERCSNECHKFDMTYYKTDLISNHEICWCLDADGKPRSIGTV